MCAHYQDLLALQASLPQRKDAGATWSGTCAPPACSPARLCLPAATHLLRLSKWVQLVRQVLGDMGDPGGVSCHQLRQVPVEGRQPGVNLLLLLLLAPLGHVSVAGAQAVLLSPNQGLVPTAIPMLAPLPRPDAGRRNTREMGFAVVFVFQWGRRPAV